MQTRHKACDGCVEDRVCLWQKRGEVGCCPDVRESIANDEAREIARQVEIDNGMRSCDEPTEELTKNE